MQLPRQAHHAVMVASLTCLTLAWYHSLTTAAESLHTPHLHASFQPLLAAIQQCCQPTCLAGQGYNPAKSDPSSVLRASEQAEQTLKQQLQSSRVIQARWRQLTKAACHGPGANGVLCQSLLGSDSVEYGQLILATSPMSYNASDMRQTGGFNPVNTPRDQRPCEACVGFTVTAAAESAIASVLQVNASGTLQLSPQDLQFW